MLDLQRGQKISIQTVCRTWTLEVELRHQGPGCGPLSPRP